MLLRPLSQQAPRGEWIKWRKRGKRTRYSCEPHVTWINSQISFPSLCSLHIHSHMKVPSYQHFQFPSLSLRFFPVFTCSLLSAFLECCAWSLTSSVNQLFPPHPLVQWQSSRAASLPQRGCLFQVSAFDWHSFFLVPQDVIRKKRMELIEKERKQREQVGAGLSPSVKFSAISQ